MRSPHAAVAGLAVAAESLPPACAAGSSGSGSCWPRSLPIVPAPCPRPASIPPARLSSCSSASLCRRQLLLGFGRHRSAPPAAAPATLESRQTPAPASAHGVSSSPMAGSTSVAEKPRLGRRQPSKNPLEQHAPTAQSTQSPPGRQSSATSKAESPETPAAAAPRAKSAPAPLSRIPSKSAVE